MSDLLPWHQSSWNRLQKTRRQGRMPHALLLSGAQGLGKAHFARQLAESLLCEQPADDGLACGQCRQCLLLKAGSHPDLRQVEPEEGKQQISIDAVRELVAGNTLSVGEGAHRIFILDPADSMGRSAANALLKTLEEPIPGSLILLVSSHAERLPVTIRSRCQTLAFTLPGEGDAITWIEENTGARSEQARQLLQLASGAPLSVPALIEADELQRHNRLLGDFAAIAVDDASVVQIGENWLKETSLPHLLKYMIAWLSAIIRSKMTPASQLAFPPLQTLPERLDLILAYQFLDRLYDAERKSMNNLNPQLALESILLEWSRIASGEG
ncbi:DNA polymerase III subunit delta' [Thiolapillus sp.]